MISHLKYIFMWIFLKPQSTGYVFIWDFVPIVSVFTFFFRIRIRSIRFIMYFIQLIFILKAADCGAF